MALATDRNTRRREGDIKEQGLAASVVCYAGALLMRNASGYLTKGQTATGLVGVGVAQERKTGGANAGDERIKYRAGVHLFKNSASTDQITVANVGDPCYAVDDEQVAKTDGTGTRSIAGFVDDVDGQGVWVHFDEIAVMNYLAGITNPVA